MTKKFRYDLEFDEDTHWRLVRLGALNKVQHEDFLESMITSTIETLAMDEEEEESTQANHIPDATKMVPPPVATDEELAPLLWVLWYHQGGKSDVGQPIRKYLGMGQFERMSDKQIEVAKHWAQSNRQAGIPEVAEPAPVAGEVMKLIQCLQLRAASLDAEGATLVQRGDADYFGRAATMLQQLGGQQAGKGDDPDLVAGGLVKRVAETISTDYILGWAPEPPEARSAILATAMWLRDRGLIGSADVLEREVWR
jgi:hypothetical protein